MTVVLLPDERSAPPSWLTEDAHLTAGDGRLFEHELRAVFEQTVDAGRRCSLLVLEPEGDAECFLDVLVGLALVEAGEEAGAFALVNRRFALLLPGTPLERALALGRIVQLRVRFLSEGRTRVHVGAAGTDADTPPPEELFARADLAAGEADASGTDWPVAFGHPYPQPTAAASAVPRLLADLDRWTGPSGTRARPGSGPQRLAAAVGGELAARLLAENAVGGPPHASDFQNTVVSHGRPSG